MSVPRDAAEPADKGDGSGGAVTGALSDPAHVLARLGGSWTWLMASALATLMPGAPAGVLGLRNPLAVDVAGIVVLALPAESARTLTRLLGLWLGLLGLTETVVALGRRCVPHGTRPSTRVTPVSRA
ncbi:hypothetical protein [Streptomyces sp. ME02-6985-2c]|uniref:hypothetical protein n=1 Tax=Streptomyces TaxID=1883 RepID=UPI0039F6E86F